jgi:hypothetical protein
VGFMKWGLTQHGSRRCRGDILAGMSLETSWCGTPPAVSGGGNDVKAVVRRFRRVQESLGLNGVQEGTWRCEGHSGVAERCKKGATGTGSFIGSRGPSYGMQMLRI